MANLSSAQQQQQQQEDDEDDEDNFILDPALVTLQDCKVYGVFAAMCLIFYLCV